MNDKTQDPGMLAAIDSIAAASSSSTNVTTPQPNLRYNTESGVIEQSGPSVDAPIPERGEVPEVALAQIQANVKALVDKLNAERDPSKREVLGAQLARAHEAAQYDVSRLNALQAQREARARADEAAAAEKLAAIEFSGGDKARAEAFAKALTEAEAREAAQAVLANRGRR